MWTLLCKFVWILFYTHVLIYLNILQVLFSILALLALTLAQDPISSIAEGELDDTVRVKRSGTSIISTLQKNVFGASAQLSAGSSSSVSSGIAGLSSGSSSGSSSGHESGHGYETGHSFEESHVSSL